MPARKGECVLTQAGLEGSLIYAHSAAIRDRIASQGSAEIVLDLLCKSRAASSRWRGTGSASGWRA